MRHFTSLCACLVLAAAAAPVALPAQTPTFAPPKQISVGATSAQYPYPYLYLYGDFTGNGNTDLVVDVYDYPYPDRYKLLTGNGKGDFAITSKVDLSNVDFATALVGDMNGDGKDDIVNLVPGCPSSFCSQNGTIRILLSDGDGHFTPGYTGPLPPEFNFAAGLIGDFNNDGRLDIAVVNFSPVEPIPTPELAVFLNQGDGSFTRTIYDLAAVPSEFVSISNPVLGDFEGNGSQELAFVAESALPSCALYTMAIDAQGRFGPAQVKYTFDSFSSQPTIFAANLYAADLNGDGRTDLVPGLNPRLVNGNEVGGIRFPTLLALPSGSFKWSSVRYGPLLSGNFVLADINGDSKPDLIFAADGGNYSNETPPHGFIYLGLGNGEFQTPHIPFTVSGGVSIIFPFPPLVAAIPLKTGDLPSLIVSNSPSTLELLINTTKK